MKGLFLRLEIIKWQNISFIRIAHHSLLLCFILHYFFLSLATSFKVTFGLVAFWCEFVVK